MRGVDSFAFIRYQKLISDEVSIATKRTGNHNDMSFAQSTHTDIRQNDKCIIREALLPASVIIEREQGSNTLRSITTSPTIVILASSRVSIVA